MHISMCIYIYVYTYLHVYIYIHIYICVYICKIGNSSQGQPLGSLFNSYYTEEGDGTNPFDELLHFTLDMYLITVSVKQGGIKYHFLSLWYNSIRD